MSTLTTEAHAILMQRSLEMNDVSGVYALAAKSTAARLSDARKQMQGGELDDDEYIKLLKTIQAEDQLMTSVAKNIDKSVEIRDKPASNTIVIDYDAKLKAIR